MQAFTSAHYISLPLPHPPNSFNSSLHKIQHRNVLSFPYPKPIKISIPACTSAAPPESEYVSSIEGEDEDEFEIEVRKVEKRNRRIIESRIRVDADLETVWSVLTNYEGLADFIPGLAVSQLMEKGDKFAKLYQQHANRTHLKKLQEWGPVNAEALSILHGSGFDLISKINTGFKTNWKLINEFVNAYDDEGYCFVFGDKKITPTLEDVARITGFPIDGTAVTGKDFGEDACKKLSVELLNDDYVLPGSSEIIFSKLLECRQFENAEQINFYVRAYALFVIACFLLPGKAQDAVPCMYLSLLEDVNKIKDYAWGSALLCQMHNELAAHKKHGTKTSFAFCVPFLEIFFFEHFPMLPKTLYDVDVANVDHSTELSEFPLVVGWTSLLELKTKNSYTRPPVNDVLNVENICWQPYKRLPNNFLPLYLQLQMPVSSAFTVMICFSKFAWHLPFTCPLKFGREEGEVLAQSYDVFKLQSKKRNAIKVDWKTFHAAKRPMESWKSRLQNIVYPSYYEGRYGKPEEVAGLVEFLALSPASSYITGQVGQQNLALGLKFDAKGVVECYEKEIEILPFGRRRNIEFKMVEGDFRLFEGKWSIEQADSSMCKEGEFRTIISYVVELEPKFRLPVRLLEGRISNEVKINLYAVREEAQRLQKHGMDKISDN